MVQRQDSSAIASNPLQADEFLEGDWIRDTYLTMKNGNTYACSITRIPTSVASTRLWKNT